MLNLQDRKKLDRVFRQFQQFRQREWACSDQATWSNGIAFIRRGPLLLFGNWVFQGLFVITPFQAKLGKVEVTDQAMAKIQVEVHHDQGKAVRIYDEDCGPWWELLQQELVPLEEWVKYLRTNHDQVSKRYEGLEAATRAVQTVLNFGSNVH